MAHRLGPKLANTSRLNGDRDNPLYTHIIFLLFFIYDFTSAIMPRSTLPQRTGHVCSCPSVTLIHRVSRASDSWLGMGNETFVTYQWRVLMEQNNIPIVTYRHHLYCSCFSADGEPIKGHFASQSTGRHSQNVYFQAQPIKLGQIR